MSSINLFEEATTHQQRLSTVLRRGRWTIPVYGAVIVASVMILGLAGRSFVLRRNKTVNQVQTPVFFELKALDEAGHPIVGAQVLIDGVARGHTDSYGEWRQYLRSQPGAHLEAAIEKKSDSDVYSAVKNIIIPLQPKGQEEIEVRQTMVVAKQTLLRRTEDKATSAPQPIADPNLPQDFNYDRIAIEFEKNLDRSSDDSVEGFVNLKLIPSLRRYLSRLGMTEDASSQWKLKISLLTSPSKVVSKSDLIKVTSEGNIPQELKAKFLRNVIADADAMAVNLFETLRMHIPFNYRVQKDHSGWSVRAPQSASDFFAVTTKDFLVGAGGKLLTLQTKNAPGPKVWLSGEKNPCAGAAPSMRDDSGEEFCQLPRASLSVVPPKSKWQKIEVFVNPKAGEKIESRLELYVLGFPPASIDENLYRFWAPQNEPINLTWIDGVRVVSREKWVVPQDMRINVEAPREKLNVARNTDAVQRQERL